MDLIINKCQNILVRDPSPSLREFRKEFFAIQNSPRGRTVILKGLCEFMKIVRENPNYIALAQAFRPVIRQIIESEFMFRPIEAMKWIRNSQDKRLYEEKKLYLIDTKGLLFDGVYSPTIRLPKGLINNKNENINFINGTLYLGDSYTFQVKLSFIAIYKLMRYLRQPPEI